jgi:hypothetical protein
MKNTPDILEKEKETPTTNDSSPNKSKKTWNTERLMTYIAFLISICTFIMFTYQTYLIQKQQLRSVLPFLLLVNSVGNNSDGERTVNLLLMNNGVGPAIIEDVTITYQGNQYKTVDDFFGKAIYSAHKISTQRNGIRAGFILPASQAQVLLGSNDSQASVVLEKIFYSNDFNIEIVYASLYEETWKITYKSGEPTNKPIKVD